MAPYVCGDYKVTINPVLQVDQYPVPKADDLLATLAGGQKFSMLDLSQAYQQVLLEEDSHKYVTINVHEGLYRFNRLPFGVASLWCIVVCVCVDCRLCNVVTCTHAQCPRVLFDVLEHSITSLICVYILYVYVKE